MSELEIYNNFINAKSGNFNGFEMVDIFHKKINKEDALYVAEANDGAEALGISVGADGITCYFFVEPNAVTKKVFFNRSVYLF